MRKIDWKTGTYATSARVCQRCSACRQLSLLRTRQAYLNCKWMLDCHAQLSGFLSALVQANNCIFPLLEAVTGHMSLQTNRGQKRKTDEAGLNQDAPLVPAYVPQSLPVKESLALLQRYFSRDPLCKRSADKDGKDGKDAKDAKDSAAAPHDSDFSGLLDPRLLPTLQELPASLLDVIIAVKSEKSKYPHSLGAGNWFRLLDAMHSVAMSRKVAAHRAECVCELADCYQPTIDDADVSRDLARFGCGNDPL